MAEAVDAEQLIAKSNSYVEYQLTHIKKRNIVAINVYRPLDCRTEKFSSPLNELKTKLIEIGNPMPNIKFTGDLNFPIIDWQMETADGGTHENQVPANTFFAIYTGTMLTSIYIIIIIIKKGWKCKAGRERLTPYQSEDPNPTTPTHRKKEEKGKTVGDKKGASS